jgi:hypothetical protein
LEFGGGRGTKLNNNNNNLEGKTIILLKKLKAF